MKIQIRLLGVTPKTPFPKSHAVHVVQDIKLATATLKVAERLA